MTGPVPPIDSRGYDELVDQTEQLAALFSPWRPPVTGDDPGRALIRAFAGMARQVLDRLNRIPDRDLLVFLDLIGAEPLAARAATVALTFEPPDGSDATALVPAGTSVGPDPADPNAATDIGYRTQEDLVVVPARLVAAIVREPDADRVADVTASATGLVALPWPGFVGDTLAEHALHLAEDATTALPPPRSLRVGLSFADAASADRFAGLPLEWAWWDGAAWRSITPAWTRAGDHGYTVDLPDVGTPEPHDIGGRQGRWLRALLTRAVTVVGAVPALVSVTVGATVTREPDRLPMAAFAGTTSADLGADVFPFGPQPAFGGVFALADDVFGQVGAEVTMAVTVSPGVPALIRPSLDLVLLWEVGGADGWTEIGRSGPGATASGADFSDGTAALSGDGQVRLTVPPTGDARDTYGVRSWWLRVRIVAGDYGRPAGYRAATTAEQARTPGQTIVLTPSTLGPPALASVRLGHRLTRDVPPSGVVVVNGADVVDRTGDPSGLVPFVAATDRHAELYLGFDRPFPNAPVAVYVQVVEPGQAMPLTWEYASSTGWAPLAVVDDTRGLTRSGAVRFVGPADLAPTAQLGRTFCWLRARRSDVGRLTAPRLGRVLTNTVMAEHSLRHDAEVLGFSDGTPGQRLRTAATPVLDGELVEVLEATGWQPWSAVPTLAASGADDRQYVLDRALGDVTFGDGRRGAVPVAGGAVRITYRSGGGAAGNRPPATITQLTAALAGVAAVTNHEAAAGGADAEPVERVRMRGPRSLRHGDRAVTAEDYADLARDASADVVRAVTQGPAINPLDVAWIDPVPVTPGAQTGDGSVLCHASDADVAAKAVAGAGAVSVAVVPARETARLDPAPQLLAQVSDLVRARCPVVLGPAELAVVGPAWIEVTVHVTVRATDLGAAQGLPAAIGTALARFLHPLRGGADGAGWEFGRVPHLSDMYAVVAATRGVDHVGALRVDTVPDPATLDRARLARSLVRSGAHTVTVAAS